MARKRTVQTVRCHRCGVRRLAPSEHEWADGLSCVSRAKLPPLIAGMWQGRLSCGSCLRELAALAEYRRRRAG